MVRTTLFFRCSLLFFCICRWISGFDGGEKALVAFSTQYAEYYLMEPSIAYQPMMKVVKQKIALCKLVIEFLLDEFWQNPTYEDLLQKLTSSGHEELTEEALMRHAHFICDQVRFFTKTFKI